MRAILSAFLILWLSVFSYNGAYAYSIQPLDQPIKAISSGEFGLPSGHHVLLHSYLPVHGPEGEAIVRGIYSGNPIANSTDVQHQDFLWSATKIIINPTSWTTGIGLASLACSALAWWNTAPSWVNYTCNSFGIASAMFGVWSGRSDLVTAWNDWKNEPSYQGNLESLQLMPFYDEYAVVVNNVGKRGGETGYWDWSVLHPHLANRTISNLLSGNGSILHDVGRNYSIITMAHVLNSTDANPILTQRSINGTLLGSPVSMFLVNGTGNTAGLGSHHAFGKATTSAYGKRDDGNCYGFGNDGDDVFADNTALCAGDGTTSEDGITGVYYGMDFYGTQAQWEEYDADAGGQYPDSNGVWHLASELSDDTQNSQWWRSCMCDQESGQWAWTGSLQYTWSGGYNGYADCYAANCGAG